MAPERAVQNRCLDFFLQITKKYVDYIILALCGVMEQAPHIMVQLELFLVSSPA